MRVAWVLAVIAIGVSLTPLGGAANDAESAFGLRVFARGFDSPVLVTQAPGEPSTHYVVEQSGRVIRLRGSRRTVFLDVSGDIVYGGEQGLLGLAFHPNYARNRLFYVAYTSDDGRNVVERFRSNGRKAVRSTRARLLSIPDPYGNHNGGNVTFGPDGLLYTSIGDSGAGGDPEDRAQNMRSQVRQASDARRLEAGRALEDRCSGAAEPLAVLVRPRDRRPLHRRRRPERDRGGGLHAAP